MARSCLVGLVHDKALSISTTTARSDDARTITLMSSDVETLFNTAVMFHDAWAHSLEVLIGMTLLSRNIDWISPILLILIFGKSHCAISHGLMVC